MNTQCRANYYSRLRLELCHFTQETRNELQMRKCCLSFPTTKRTQQQAHPEQRICSASKLLASKKKFSPGARICFAIKTADEV